MHQGHYNQSISVSQPADAYVTVSCASCTKIEYYTLSNGKFLDADLYSHIF